MNKNKLHIKKGDLVQVMVGKHKGERGQVLRIEQDRQKAIVEKINLQTHYVKSDQQNPKGGLLKKEGWVHISNLMLIDPKTGTPTRVGRKKNDKNKLQRYAKKTGEFI